MLGRRRQAARADRVRERQAARRAERPVLEALSLPEVMLNKILIELKKEENLI